MSNATLDGADLSNAILDGARLNGASLVGVTGLTAESLATLEQWDGMLLQSEEEILAQLWQVCEGKGVERAAAYDPDQGATSILLITDQGKKYPTTGSWWPASVSNAELVACLDGPYTAFLESCTYVGGSTISRRLQRIDISIFVARTGELLRTITLDGTWPSACPEEIIVADDKRPEFRSGSLGAAPSGSQIIEALIPFMHKGGPLHAPRLP